MYAQVLGPAWLQLAEPVRFAHASGSTVRARGQLRIAHGRNPAARLLARLMRLPHASDGAETRLVVTPDAGGQHWRRTFNGRHFDSRQYRAGDGRLAERIRGLEFRFRLEALAGSLFFRQLDAAVVLGPIRWRLPAALAPRVEAREDPAGVRLTRIEVCVTVPALGVVLTYDGTIETEETRA